MRLRPDYVAPCLLALTLGVNACGGGGSASAPVAPTQQQSGSIGSSPGYLPPPTSDSAAPGSSVEDEAPAPAPEASEGQAIKLLALYSTGVADRYAEPALRIEHLVNVANQVAADSGLMLDVQVVHTVEVAYPDEYPMVTALEAATLASHSAFSQVPALRDHHAADLVALFRLYGNDGLCGYAWLGGAGQNGDFSRPAEADFAYSVLAVDCSDYTLLHELGHNFGLAHSRRENPAGGSLPHGAGYGVDNSFTTIMADATQFNGIRLPRLSSPELSCNDQPCGVPATDPQHGADAVQALREAREQIAGYR